MNKQSSEEIIKIEHVSKQYRLGVIGGTTLREELQRLGAKIKKKEDPTLKIGEQRNVGGRETFLALDDVSISINKGEAVGIIGHNGAGKSTLLKLLCRVTAPTQGKISYNGRIASMLEVGTGFHGELTGRENVYMNGAILGMTRKEIDAKMEDIIEFSECRQFIDTPVKRYSSGMYVKLAFSVAAHLDSEIMIMDEVLAVGDMAFQKKCLTKMREAAKEEGRTVLYVSHNMNTIRQLCSRVIVLNRGKVVFDGDVETGIEIYLSSGEESKAITHYIYDKSYHKSGRSVGKFIIKEMTLQNGIEAKFELNEAIVMELVCQAMTKLKNVKFRFEIQHTDSTRVATSLSEQELNFAPGEEKKLSVIVNTSSMMAGKYNMDIVAYTEDEYGQEYFLDGVYPGFYFTILEGSGELIWNHQYWGHIRLNDVQVLDVNEVNS